MLRTLRHPGAALRHHLKTRTRGQSLVELALILPVFMLFFAAVLDLGRIAAAQIAVQNAAREGAFQAAKTPTDFDSTTGCPAGAATNVIYCRIKLESSGGVSIAPTDVDVRCQPASCNTGIGNTVTVSVTGHFRLLTPLVTRQVVRVRTRVRRHRSGLTTRLVPTTPQEALHARSEVRRRHAVEAER